MPAFPTGWNANATAYFKWIDGGGYTRSNHVTAAGAKMEYRFAIPDSRKGVNYKYKWIEEKRDDNGNLISATPMVGSKPITGTGDKNVPAYSETFSLDVPPTPMTINEISAEIIDTSTAGIAGN
jgi:hypothetical protein